MTPGLILDIGHAGKPAPRERDRGAVHEDRVEAVLAEQYVSAAMRAAPSLGVAVERIATGRLGLNYADRHRAACRIAVQRPDVRWLYVQAHLNSSAQDARYGLVGHDARSRNGRAAARCVADALAARLVPHALTHVRVEAATGDWSRMATTVEGIFVGPSNISGICYEPCFIQAEEIDLQAIGEALVVGVSAWVTS